MIYATSLLARASVATTHVKTAQQQVLTAQNDIASGTTITVGSDDPVGAGITLRMQASKSRIDLYIANIDSATSRQDAMDSALQEVNEVLAQARTIAVSGASSATGTADSRNAQAIEIETLISQLGALANSTGAGGYLFGGTQTDVQPFVFSGGTTTYEGSCAAKTIPITRTLSSDLALPGDQIFSSPIDAFASLTTLKNALISGDTASITSSITAIDAVTANVNKSLAKVGSSTKAMESIRGIQDSIRSSIVADISTASDTDMAEASIRLTAATTAYEAALEVASRIVTPTLLDFL